MKAVLIIDNEEKKKKACEIVALYNEFQGCNESCDIQAAHLCEIAHVPGVKGGVWMELLGGKVNVIYYAAIEKEKQRQGCLKACLEVLREKYVIHGVQVNFFDNFDLWKGLGFVRQDMVNACPTLTHLSEKEFRDLCLLANG